MFDRLPGATRQRMLDNVRILALHLPTIESQTAFTRQEAESITIPTLLLRGDSSPKQFLLVEAELAKHMPGAERALIPNTAHLLHGMNPQVYCDVVLSFLARH
jgi:pimeloyl-ACP methyl ester carboxylesterase